MGQVGRWLQLQANLTYVYAHVRLFLLALPSCLEVVFESFGDVLLACVVTRQHMATGTKPFRRTGTCSYV